MLEIINLLIELQEEFHLSYLIITHDLRLVEHIADKVAVMYLGKVVEMADAKSIYQNPVHPYTEALLSAIPIPDPEKKKQRLLLSGDIPSPIAPPQGCRFFTRCEYRLDECDKIEPELRQLYSEHWGACHFVSKKNI